MKRICLILPVESNHMKMRSNKTKVEAGHVITALASHVFFLLPFCFFLIDFRQIDFRPFGSHWETPKSVLHRQQTR